MPNTHTTLSDLFDDIADAIREKEGSSGAIVADTFPDRIAAIDTDPSGDATATADDILSPKTAYVNGQKLTGTITAVSNKQLFLSNYTSNDNYYVLSGSTDPQLPFYSDGTASVWVNKTAMGTATAADVRSTKTFTSSSGVGINGSMADSTITNNTTLPSGSTSSGTINRGSYIKFGAGYNSSDKYYLAQEDAHSSYTPSSTYFKTSTSGAVAAAKIEANKYASSDYYVKSGSVTTSAGYDYVVTPVISRQAFTISGVTDAASGAATTTTPSSGVYVKVKTAADTGSVAYSRQATAGWVGEESSGLHYAGLGGAYASADTYIPINVSTITNNTTLPSGSTSSGTINRGSYIKIGAGYNTTDKYYLAQADAHSSYTPSSTYFQTSTSGAVTAAVIEANKYASSTYYVKAMTLPTAASSTSSGTAKATIAPSTSAQYLNIPTGYNTAASYYTISAMPTSTITNNTTLPSGSTSSGTINRGSYIKIGAGYVSADTYYLAQADAHSSYTPSSTYFQTSTTGAVSAAKIEANKYAASTYYVKAAAPAFKGGSVTGSADLSSTTVTLAADDPNGVRLSISASASATRGVVQYDGAVAGWVSASDSATAYAAGSATALTGATKYITNINVPSGKALHLTTSNGTSSSDYPYIGIDSVGDFANVEIANNGGTIYVTNNDGTNNYGFVSITDSSTNSDGGAMYTAHTSTSGNLMASAYNSSGTLETFKEIVVAGKWKQNTVTPSGSAQGPFYGRTTVNAGTMASVTVSGTAMTITGGLVTLA